MVVSVTAWSRSSLVLLMCSKFLMSTFQGELNSKRASEWCRLPGKHSRRSDIFLFPKQPIEASVAILWSRSLIVLLNKCMYSYNPGTREGKTSANTAAQSENPLVTLWKQFKTKCSCCFKCCQQTQDSTKSKPKEQSSSTRRPTSRSSKVLNAVNKIDLQSNDPQSSMQDKWPCQKLWPDLTDHELPFIMFTDFSV